MADLLVLASKRRDELIHKACRFNDLSELSPFLFSSDVPGVRRKGDRLANPTPDFILREWKYNSDNLERLAKALQTMGSVPFKIRYQPVPTSAEKRQMTDGGVGTWAYTPITGNMLWSWAGDITVVDIYFGLNAIDRSKKIVHEWGRKVMYMPQEADNTGKYNDVYRWDAMIGYLSRLYDESTKK